MNESVKGALAQMGMSLREARQRILNKVLLHPHFVAAKRDLISELEVSNLVWLIGPAGIGKGTLVKHLVQEWNRPAEDDPFRVPALAIRAPTSHSAVYPWTSVYRTILRGLQDPLSDYKVDHDRRAERLKEGKKMRGKGLADDLRESVFDAVKDRGTEVLFIDEAANLLGNRRGKAVVPQLDILRDFVDGVSCKVVLACTPRILKIFEELESDCEKGAEEGLTSEIARRMAKVYFHRYGLGEHNWKEDVPAFKRIVRDFGLELPVTLRPTFSDRQFKHLQADTSGCIHLLVKRLTRVLIMCEAEGAERMEWRHFENTPVPDEEWERMEKWCRLGEELYARDKKCSGVGLERQLKLPSNEPASAHDAGKGGSKRRNGRGPGPTRVGRPGASRPRVPRRGK